MIGRIAAVSLSLLLLPTVAALAEMPAKIQCTGKIAHGCNDEKCVNVPQIPIFRIDIAAKKVCVSMSADCQTWTDADLFENKDNSITVGIAAQRMMMWVDDKMKIRGARLSRLGVAAFFGECKPL
ncbi:MAG: hypothetical protein KIT16_04245 [Rhodospirillaceae bacterium]|nr:hypothetical protein [Rhodospirillaceae bacterium]